MIRRHHTLWIAVAAAAGICTLSAGAYALASTGGGPGPAPPAPVHRVQASPRFVCPADAMCVPPCVVTGGDLATHARLAPMPARLPGHGVCFPHGFNPGGPRIPAGKPWK